MKESIEKDKNDAASHPLAALLEVLQSDSRISPDMQEAVLGAIADVEANKVGLARAGPSRRAPDPSDHICGNCGNCGHSHKDCPKKCNIKGCQQPSHSHARTCPE